MSDQGKEPRGRGRPAQKGSWAKAFGKRLRKLREAKGLELDALASRLNVTRQSVCNWEKGLRLPNYSFLGDIVRVLGASFDDLFRGLDKDAAAIRGREPSGGPA